MRAKHRTRVYISHEISHRDDHHEVLAKTTTDTGPVASNGGFSDDKENLEEDLERRDLRHSDNFKDILRRVCITKDEDSGINSTSSSDSQESSNKPKLVGILKSPGKRRHFRKHVEFLDKHEGRELDVSIRYF